MGSSKRHLGKNSRRHQNVGAKGARGAGRNWGATSVRLGRRWGAGRKWGAGANGAQQNDDDTLSSGEDFILHEAGPVTEFRSAMASPR